MYSSTIQLYKACPLSKQHTINFSSKAVQNSTFNTSWSPKTLSNYSFIRPDKNSVMVEISYNEALNYNYMRYNNYNKWFYCFIDSLSYINEETTQINYSIDVLQTYMFDWSIKESFIVRQHQVDNLYTSLEPEPLQITEYIYEKNSVSDDIKEKFSELGICVLANFNNQYTLGLQEGQIINRTYTQLNVFEFDDYKKANDFFEKVQSEGKMSEIISVYMYPKAIYPTLATQNYQYDCKPKTAQIGTYQPRNKKLFQYPFYCIAVTDNMGNELEIQPQYWEYDDLSRKSISIRGQSYATPQLICYPNMYKGKESNTDEHIIFSDFGQCATTTDVYKQWLAQSKVSMAVDAIKGVVQFSTAIASRNVSGLSGTVDTAISWLQQSEQNKRLPNQTHGQQTQSLAVALNKAYPMIYHKYLDETVLRRYDEFFELYGYAVNRKKIVTYNSRPTWNYIKTDGLNLTGSIPNQHINEIKQIFDNGVTWWSNADTILNYSLDNRT